MGTRSTSLVTPLELGWPALSGPDRSVTQRLPSIRTFIALLRPRHWLKNGLLVVPLLISDLRTDATRWLGVALGWVLFNFAASAVYVCNDLLDRRADRRHPHKRHRPFATGELSHWVGGIAIGGCLAIAGMGSLVWMPIGFMAVLGAYLVLATSYSIALKKVLLLDALLLVSLHLMRLRAGATAGGAPLPAWVWTSAFFTFFSLVMLKRYIDLIPFAADEAASRLRRRGYRVGDRDTVRALGLVCAGLGAAAVIFHSANTSSVGMHSPRVMFPLSVMLLLWLARLWVLAGRGDVKCDFLSFILHDRTNYLMAALVVIVWCGSEMLADLLGMRP
jgi:4-hydroxybenzoate polyprenyltransferase